MRQIIKGMNWPFYKQFFLKKSMIFFLWIFVGIILGDVKATLKKNVIYIYILPNFIG